MNVAALPYTLLIILVELAAGGVAVTTFFDWRRAVTRGYIQAGALIGLPLAVIALTISLTVARDTELDGYALTNAWRPTLGGALWALSLSFGVLVVASFALGARARVACGALATAAGLATLLALAGFIGAPTSSVATAILSLLAGAAVLGGALMAMSWGHWYLTNSGLPKEPLEQMSLLVVGAVAVSALLTIVGVLLPARVPPLTSGVPVPLVANPAFWLRVGVGLVFPLVLGTLAWKAASVRGMMSATGLLYVALGAVLAGELMARGILFTTGLLV